MKIQIVVSLCAFLLSACAKAPEPSIDNGAAAVDSKMPLRCVECSFIESRGGRRILGKIQNNLKISLEDICLGNRVQRFQRDRAGLLISAAARAVALEIDQIEIARQLPRRDHKNGWLRGSIVVMQKRTTKLVACSYELNPPSDSDEFSLTKPSQI